MILSSRTLNRQHFSGGSAGSAPPIGPARAVIGSDLAAAMRAFDAMMQLKKIDSTVIEAAYRGTRFDRSSGNNDLQRK